MVALADRTRQSFLASSIFGEDRRPETVDNGGFKPQVECPGRTLELNSHLEGFFGVVRTLV